MSYQDVIECLHDLRDDNNVDFRKKKFGIDADNALGISHKELNIIAREIGSNSELAIELFDSGIYEGRLLCSKVFKPQDLTARLMEKWVVTFENWEVCDNFSMGLLNQSERLVSGL